jgi:hypothetical protein
MLREPGLCGAADAALFLGPDHLGRVAVARAVLLLHLAEDEPAAAPGDDVYLVAARPRVRREDPIAAQAVVPGRAPLSPVGHGRVLRQAAAEVASAGTAPSSAGGVSAA